MIKIQRFPSEESFSPMMRRFLHSINENQLYFRDLIAELDSRITATTDSVSSVVYSHISDELGNMLIDTPGVLRIGSSGSYAQFGADGTLTLVGSATVFKDELGKLASAKLISPGGHLVQDDAEGAYYFKATATTADYLWTNIQLNYDRKIGADICIHIHWWQTSATIPNWLVQYRYQKQGAAKTTSWTSIKYLSHAFTYTSGTLDQITAFPEITPPAGDGLSDIVQVRFIRDTTNASTLFSGVDGLAGNVYLLDADIHKECDSLGSTLENVK